MLREGGARACGAGCGEGEAGVGEEGGPRSWAAVTSRLYVALLMIMPGLSSQLGIRNESALEVRHVRLH
eukprot:11818163-Prorocentrum_lima.AAC.1